MAVVALFAVALASAAGCALAPGDAATDSAASGSTPPIRSFESVPEQSASPGAIPSDLLEQVVADAATGAGVDPADVEVVTAESVTWNDGSLGCPEPGMMYTQALVPGYRVVLEVAGERMSFHSDASGEFRFCENPLPGAAGKGSR